jgi:hypothetical protein
MPTFISSPERKRYRGPNKTPKPGASVGARKCFAVYYGDDVALREAMLTAVMVDYADASNPRNRATMIVHTWAVGKRKPNYRSRLMLAPWIPMGDWDIAGEAS